jgi:hypothetical protein
MHTTNESDQFQILAECKDGYIGVCKCCWEFNFLYKNVLLTFQEPEMNEFFDWLFECRRNKMMMMPLPHGDRHVYRSPLYNLFVVYSEDELDVIEQLYGEVKLMLETIKILN